MKVRRWGAVAAALVVAGCGSSIGGQALPAVAAASSAASASSTASTASPVQTSPVQTSPIQTSPIQTSSPAVSTITPFPELSSAVTSAPITSGPAGTGTSSTGAPTSTAASSSAGSSSTATPSTTVKWLLPLPKGGADKVNKFGNVVAAPGQSFAIEWRTTKQVAVVFIVDSLQVDRGCEVNVKGKNGHLVVITVRAQLGYSTGADLSNESIGFTKGFWTAFDAKDTAQVGVDSSAASACVTYQTQMPYVDDMEPDKVYTGRIALDVSSATGTAVLMNSLDGGWVYHYG